MKPKCRPANPFSTCFVSGIPFQDSDLCSSHAIDRWRAHHYIGQIVGPHGVGKTTLARAMAEDPTVSQQFATAKAIVVRKMSIGRPTVHSEIQWQIHTPPHATIATDATRQLLIVDGIERLNRFQRWALIQNSRIQKLGLIVTTHRPLPGLPIIARLKPSLQLFRRLVTTVLNREAEHQLAVSDDIVESAYETADHNYREAFMLLYDLQVHRAAPRGIGLHSR